MSTLFADRLKELNHIERLNNDLRFSDAIDCCRKALILDPDEPKLYFALANAYIGLQNYREAESAFLAGLQFDADDASALLGLARMYRVQGQREKAIATYEQVTAIAPELPRPHMWLGALYRKQGEHAKAQKAFLAALKIDDNNSDAHVGLGYEYLEAGDISNARVEFQIATRVNPDDANAHYALGLVYEERGFIDDSIKSFKKALALDPFVESTRRHTIKVLYKAGKITDAFRIWTGYLFPNIVS